MPLSLSDVAVAPLGSARSRRGQPTGCGRCAARHRGDRGTDRAGLWPGARRKPAEVTCIAWSVALADGAANESMNSWPSPIPGAPKRPIALPGEAIRSSRELKVLRGMGRPPPRGSSAGLRGGRMGGQEDHPRGGEGHGQERDHRGAGVGEQTAKPLVRPAQATSRVTPGARPLCDTNGGNSCISCPTSEEAQDFLSHFCPSAPQIRTRTSHLFPQVFHGKVTKAHLQ